MASRRSRLELVFDILLAIQNKGGTIKPTHLMYKSNLSHKLLNNYLEELIQKELVIIEELVVKKKKRFPLGLPVHPIDVWLPFPILQLFRIDSVA